MDKKIAIIALTIGGFATSTSWAVRDCPPVSVPGGDVKPSSQLMVPLTPLVKGEYYSMICDIKNPNYSKQYPIVLSMSGGPNITLNGKPLNSGQAALTLLDNIYTVGPVNSASNTLFFQNFDNTDTATITNCVATPIVQFLASHNNY